MKKVGLIGGVIGAVLLMVILIAVIAGSGGESGRRTPLGLALTNITQQCAQYPDGSAAAYFVAPNVRAQFQPVICQVNANTIAAIANEAATPEYGVIGSAYEANISAAGANPERCSLFQNAAATGVVVACGMPDPATAADALFIAYIQGPGLFTAVAAPAP